MSSNESRREEEAHAEVHCPHRYPHHETYELLIFERCDSPELASITVPLVERPVRHGDEAAEQAAMHQGGECCAQR